MDAQHGHMLFRIDNDGFHTLDSYIPYKKLLLPDYGILYAIKYIITPLTAPKPMQPKGKGGIVRNASTGGYATNLGDVMLDAKGSDRNGLQALDAINRLGHVVTLTQEEWDVVPHKAF